MLGSQPGQRPPSCLSQRGSFSDQNCTANNKIYAEARTTQALLNDRKLEKWDFSSQINSTQFESDKFGWRHQFGWRYQRYRRAKVKGRDWGRVGGINIMS